MAPKDEWGDWGAVLVTEEVRGWLLNYMLMKLGGELTVNMHDIIQLTKDYKGFRCMYNLKTKDMVLTLKIRESENPAPEIGGPSDL